MLIIFCVFPLISLSVRVEKSYPNQFFLSWDKVKGASYYDVYIDGKPFARLEGDVTKGNAGSNEQPLFSNSTHEIIVAARDQDNKDLDAGKVKATTSSWSGSYSWKNSTKKDNKGRCVSLRFVLDDRPSLMVIQSDLPELGLEVVSPMPVTGNWVDYDDDQALTYRANGRIFNTTNFTPSSFLIVSVEQDASRIIDTVKTKAVGMTFSSTSTYELLVTEQGKRAVRFDTTGSGLAATGIFKNPEKGSDGKFLLVEESY